MINTSRMMSPSLSWVQRGWSVICLTTGPIGPSPERGRREGGREGGGEREGGGGGGEGGRGKGGSGGGREGGREGREGREGGKVGRGRGRVVMYIHVYTWVKKARWH